MCNGRKRIISSNGRLGLFQMVLELDTERCINENVGPPKEVDCEIPREGNELFIHVTEVLGTVLILL